MRTIFNFSFLALLSIMTSSCAVMNVQLMVQEEELLWTGKFPEVVEIVDSKYPERLKSQLRANDNTSIYFTYSMEWLITALIETGDFKRADLECDRMIALLEKNRFSSSLSLNTRGLNIERKLMSMYYHKALISWFQTGDKEVPTKYLEKIDVSRLPPEYQIDLNSVQGFFYNRLLGNYPRAIHLFNTILSLTNSLDLFDIDKKFAYSLQAYRQLTHLYLKLGRLQDAKNILARYEKNTHNLAFQAGKKLIDSNELFRGYIAMMDTMAGNAYALMQDFSTAKKFYDRAWEVIKHIDPMSKSKWDQIALGSYYVYYGTSYLGLQQNTKSAIKNVDRGLEYLKPYYGDSLTMEITIENAYIYSAELYYSDGKTKVAYERATIAKKYADRYFNKITAARALTLLGTINIENNRTPMAIEGLKTAVDLINGTESTENWRLFYTLGQTYEKRNDQDKALQYYIKAVDEVEKLWEGRLHNTLKQLSLMEDRLIVFEPVINILIKNKKWADALAYMEKSKARALYETPLFFDVINTKKYNSGKPLNTSQIQQKLPRDFVVLEYYVGENIVTGVALTRDNILAKILPLSAQQLTQAINNFRNSIQGKDTTYSKNRNLVEKKYTNNGSKPIYKTSNSSLETNAIAIYKQLIQPFDSLIHQVENARLCIIPHGILHYLPFQALITDSSPINEQGPSWLITQYPITYSPSTSILLASKRNNLQKRERLLAVGSPPTTKIPLDGQEYNKLSYAETEINEVSKLFRIGTTYIDKRATETAVRNNMKLADILLFSTHGILIRNNPLKSCLLFNKDAKNDGLLTVAEIEQLPNHANLVVLSACESGILVGHEGMNDAIINVKFPPGDDLFGLQRAFMSSGSSSVLSTLWPVFDDSTATLVTTFFRLYKKDGLDKDIALQNAQIEMIKNSPKWNHPKNWAPFILSGDWQ